MRFHVFISYSSQDREAAERVREALESRGWRCWMAPRDVGAGDDWAAAIEDAIRHSAVLVVIFSERSNASRHVRREVVLGDDSGCALIPYRIAPVLPQGTLRYFLCATHWLDASEGGNGRLLGRLCAAVERELSRSPASPALPAAVPARLRALELRLVNAMLEQGQVVVCLDSFSNEELESIQQLEACGVLVNKPSPTLADVRFTAPATPEQCDRILLQWIVANGALPAAELLQRVARLPLLADALGRFLTDPSLAQQWQRLEEIVQGEAPEVESVTAAAVSHALPDSERFGDVLQSVVKAGGYAAARGLASAAQRCLEGRQADSADALLAAVNRWGESRDLDPSQRSFLVIEVANEQGRLWRRQGQQTRAEAHFRRTLETAICRSEPTLAAIVSINLARVLLDQPTPDRVEEAIGHLRYAVEQLQDPRDQRYLAAAYHNLGDAYARRDPQLAESFFRQDIDLCRQHDDVHELTDALDRLGVFLADSGRYAEALEVHREAERLFPRYADPCRQARVLANLGRAWLGLARRTHDGEGLVGARDVLLRSSRLFSALDEPRLYAPTLENLGRTQFLLGEAAAGTETLRHSIRQYRCWRGADGAAIAAEIEQELGDR